MKNNFKYQYKCELPGNLNLEGLLRKHPIYLNVLQNRPDMVRDRIAFIMDTLVKGSYGKDIDRSGRVGNEVISMCSAIMQCFTRDYKTIMEYLYSHNIIDLVKKHEKGVNCTMYKF